MPGGKLVVRVKLGILIGIMRVQANNLGIFRGINNGAPSPSNQVAVCAFSRRDMWLQLPTEPTGVIKPTVADGGGYRSRIPVVIDP
jgi:hypothetical protein